MEPLKPKRKHPEKDIQNEIVKMLRYKGWYVKETHGNMYQSGFPDIFATHHVYKQRWIEVKLPQMKGSKYTPAQLECFPLFVAHGCPIYVLTAATEAEYQKLFKDTNWHTYLRIMK